MSLLDRETLLTEIKRLTKLRADLPPGDRVCPHCENLYEASDKVTQCCVPVDWHDAALLDGSEEKWDRAWERL